MATHQQELAGKHSWALVKVPMVELKVLLIRQLIPSMQRLH